MRNIFSKKGSFTVFAIMLFVALIAGIFVIINAAGSLAVSSSVNSFGILWGKSILSEYDLKLMDKYGLMAFYADQYSVEEKLLKYMEYSFDEKEYISYERPVCQLDKSSLADTENLLKQIKIISLESVIPKVDRQENTLSDGRDVSLRTISNPWIIKNLPSYEKTEKFYVAGLVEKIKSGIDLKKIAETGAIDRYIFTFFKDYMEERDLGETYFNYEVEYIISGDLSDSELIKGTENKLVLIRNMLNLFYLYSSDEKRESALALANAITPGAMAFITQGVLLEGWAYAEAVNDLKIIKDNKAVPLLKKDCNWALTIENVFDSKGNQLEQNEKGSDKNYVSPQKVEGSVYSDYLKILLQGVPDNTKLLRILDLIQINMKYIYCDYFLVKDYYCGLSYTLKVNGNEYEFNDEYA